MANQISVPAALRFRINELAEKHPATSELAQEVGLKIRLVGHKQRFRTIYKLSACPQCLDSHRITRRTTRPETSYRRSLRQATGV